MGNLCVDIVCVADTAVGLVDDSAAAFLGSKAAVLVSPLPTVLKAGSRQLKAVAVAPLKLLAEIRMRD